MNSVYNSALQPRYRTITIMIDWAIFGISLAVFLIASIAFMAAFYKRATKDISFVRTGFGGEAVVRNGGAIVMPVLHEFVPVNMKTLQVKIERDKKSAMITKDPLRVDVVAEFKLKVSPDDDAISTAARTLGNKTMNPKDIHGLVEEQCVATLRSVASSMTLSELHLKRPEFQAKVEQSINSEFAKNGLTLESVSLVRLDQTAKEHFDKNNAFDAQGLAVLNSIIREKEVEIQKRDLDAEKKKLEMELQEFVSQKEREKDREERESQVQRDIEDVRLSTEREIEEMKIAKEAAIEAAKHDLEITKAQLEKSVNAAWIESDKVSAEAASMREQIATAREKAEAERNRIVEIISAEKESQRQKIIAEANAEVEKLAAAAATIRYEAEALGKKALNEASNILSNQQIDMQVKLEIVKHLPQIVRESVRPMENIDGIKIFQVDGLNQGGAAGAGQGGGSAGVSPGNGGAGGGPSLPDQVVNSALRYRAHLPFVESIMKEAGLQGGDINGLTENLRQEFVKDKPTGEDHDTGSGQGSRGEESDEGREYRPVSIRPQYSDSDVTLAHPQDKDDDMSQPNPPDDQPK